MKRMKTIFAILFVSTFLCCNSSDKKNSVDTSVASKIDTASTNSDRWNFDKYLNDTHVSALAKNIFLQKDWDLKDTKILAFLDSLTAKDKQARPFYFSIVTKTIKKADGYYTESLISKGKEYIEHNTKEFLNYFVGENSFTPQQFDDWARIVGMELSQIAFNGDSTALNKTIIKLLTLKKIDRFGLARSVRYKIAEK